MELFAILTKNHNQTYQRVNLPNRTYKWESLNESIVTVDSQGLVQAYGKIGDTSVRVTDVRALGNKIETRVHVVEPWTI